LREQDFGGPVRGRRHRFDDDEPSFVRRQRPRVVADDRPELEAPPFGDRWSNWGNASVMHGPEPWPDWVITDLGAVDTDLGVLKTGKEADVSLLERVVPDTDRAVLLAAKRYRSTEHRMFHRDAGYLEGRRVRRSRTNRAMDSRTAFGRQVIAAQWAAAEFAALTRLWELGTAYGGLRVPYPVQLDGTELLLEFIGDVVGEGAPRLVQTRPEPDELPGLWQQTVDALTVLARAGLAHGDLSPYNVLLHGGQLVLIDLPQVVDVVANPQGPEFLTRDVRVMADWFTGRGYPVDAAALTGDLLRDAGIR
jgi:RIO kinase 1